MNSLEYQYDLVTLKVFEFSYSEIKFMKDYNPEQGLKLDWLFNTQFMVQQENEAIFITFNYLFRNPGIEEPFATVSLGAIFKLHNYVDKLDESGKFIVDPRFAASLLGVIYSTLRGVCHERFKDTPIENFIIPVIDPMEINYTVEYLDNSALAE